jgi:hypothetical protein
MLGFYFVEQIQERIYQVAKDDVFPTPSLGIWEAAMVNDSHLLYDCRFPAISSSWSKVSSPYASWVLETNPKEGL